jgi:hypothetical protein
LNPHLLDRGIVLFNRLAKGTDIFYTQNTQLIHTKNTWNKKNLKIFSPPNDLNYNKIHQQHNMSRSLPPYQETYLRRKQAQSDLRLSDTSTAASLDGEDRAYFRHIYVKRA